LGFFRATITLGMMSEILIYGFILHARFGRSMKPWESSRSDPAPQMKSGLKPGLLERQPFKPVRATKDFSFSGEITRGEEESAKMPFLSGW